MNDKPLVSLIILTHDRASAFEACLESVYSQDYPNTEIIVVDNGSGGRIVSFLKSQAEQGKIKLILNTGNLGACIARNRGFTESSGRYVLFLDSDVVLTGKETVSTAMQEISRHEKLGQLGGIGVFDEKFSKIHHALLKFNSGLELDLQQLTRLPEDINFDVDYVQSDFMLLKREVFEKSAGFDPFYFYYSEDSDLSFRIRKVGSIIAVTPMIKFWHRYIPRRAEINHSYFCKQIYFCLKNLSMLSCINYYASFFKAGLKRSAGSLNKTKYILLLSWYLTSVFFFLWFLLYYPLIKLRSRINFISPNKYQNYFLSISEKLIKLPLTLEDRLIAGTGHLLFLIKRLIKKKGLYLFITDRCNYSCIHCFLPENLKKNTARELTVSEIKTAYSSLRKKIGGVTITGGEPFLREDIVDICKIFQETPSTSTISLNTNGFNPDLIKKEAEEILLNSAKGQKIVVTVSLDGLKEVHDRIRNTQGSFDRAVMTIRSLKSLGQNYGNFKVRAQFTLMESNYNDFYSLFNFVSKDLGVDFSFNWFRDGSAYGVNKNLLVAPVDANLCKLPSMEICETIGEFLLENNWYDLEMNMINRYTLEILRDKRLLFPCVAPDLNLVIYANGDISFCELIKPTCNIRNFDYNLKKILKSKEWKKASRAVKKCVCVHPCILGINLQKKHFLDFKLEGLRTFKEA